MEAQTDAREVLWFFLARKNRSFRKVGKKKLHFCTKGENKQKKTTEKIICERKSALLFQRGIIVKGSSSEKEHKENALASGADEGRD